MSNFKWSPGTGGDIYGRAARIKMVTSDHDLTSTTTYTAETELQHSMIANTRYALEACILMLGETTVPNIKTRFNAGATWGASSFAGMNLVTGNEEQWGCVAAATTSVTTLTFTQMVSQVSENYNLQFSISGAIMCNASSDATLDFESAPGTSTANYLRLLAGSWVRLTRID